MLEVKNAHHLVTLTEKPLDHSGLFHRAFISDYVWKVGDSNDSVTLVSLPVARELAVVAAGGHSTAVIGEATKVFRLTKLTERSCKLTFFSSSSFGGRVPRALVQKYFSKEALSTLRRTQTYFLQSIPLEAFTAQLSLPSMGSAWWWL